MHVCTMATLKDIGLATNVNDSMDADGMAAAGVTQASEQAKSREFLTKHWYKKQEDDCHSVDMEIACGRQGGCGGGHEEQAQGETTSGMDGCWERVGWTQRGERRMA